MATQPELRNGNSLLDTTKSWGSEILAFQENVMALSMIVRQNVAFTLTGHLGLDRAVDQKRTHPVHHASAVPGDEWHVWISQLSVVLCPRIAP